MSKRTQHGYHCTSKGIDQRAPVEFPVTRAGLAGGIDHHIATKELEKEATVHSSAALITGAHSSSFHASTLVVVLQTIISSFPSSTTL